MDWGIGEFVRRCNEKLKPLGYSVTEDFVKQFFWGRMAFDGRDLLRIFEYFYAEKAKRDKEEAEHIEEEQEQAKMKRRETKGLERKIKQAEWKLDPGNESRIKRHRRTYYLKRKSKRMRLSEQEEGELSILLSERWIKRNIIWQ